MTFERGRLVSYLTDDAAGLAARVQMLVDFREWTGRFDYVYLYLAAVADRRLEVGPTLDAIVQYVSERGLNLVTAQARRARGVEKRDRADLAAALEAFEQMGAKPWVARVQTELGMLTGNQELVDLGLDGLESLGDVEHAARVAMERRAGLPSAAPAGG